MFFNSINYYVLRVAINMGAVGTNVTMVFEKKSYKYNGFATPIVLKKSRKLIN